MQTTLADVAREAGVSKMTASRALSGKGYASANAKAKVEAAADRLGYRPNPMVRSLMSGVRQRRVEQRGQLLWIDSYPSEDRTPWALLEMLEGAKIRADHLGYLLTLERLDGLVDCSQRALSRRWVNRGVSGVIVGPLLKSGTRLDLPWSDFAFSTLGRSLAEPLLHSAMFHYPHAMRRLLVEAAAGGAQRIGYAHLPELDARAEESALMVMEHYCLRAGIDPALACPSYDNWERENWRQWVKRFQPDLVIGDNVNICDWLRDAGFQIPEDLQFFTLSRRDRSDEIMGIRFPYRDLGSAAVDLVAAQVERNERGIPKRPKTLMLEGDWVSPHFG